MTVLRQTLQLLRWEIAAERRERFGLASVFLYVVTTVVIVYFAGREVWGGAAGEGARGLFNMLFWILVFFGATVACGRSFLRSGGRRHLYYYQLAAPEALLVSKTVYNVAVIYLIGLLTYGLLAFFTGSNPVVSLPYLLLTLLLGSLGLGAVLTFVSALAARAGGSGTLMAILSFPLVIPLLYLLTIAGQHAVGTASVGRPATPLLLTAAVDLVALAVGLVLFPFVWRD